MSFRTTILVLAVAWVAACSKAADRAGAGDSAPAQVEATADSQSMPAGTAGPLTGTSWQLVRFQSMDDKVLTPDDRTKYTLSLNSDSSVSVKADCNSGTGTWSSPGPSALTFSQVTSTLAICAAGSMSDRYLRDFQYMRSYVLKEGKLYISLMADGGIYEFEPEGAARPSASFDCSKASREMEKLVCGSPKLSELDQKLAEVYSAAEAKQGTPVPNWFIATQRGWVKGRDDCWKAPSRIACVDSAYRLRIAELQATSGLVDIVGPVTYRCNGVSGGEVIATFAKTDPATVVVARGDKSVIAFAERAASGTKYEGANVMFWSKEGDATVTWFEENLECKGR